MVKRTTNSTMLYMDYDSPDGRFKLARNGPTLVMLWTVLRALALRPLWIEHDRTARGWHVIIALPEPVTPAEQVAIQAVMGSDRRRELLNVMRVLSIRRKGAPRFWRARWNLLFSRKLT